MIRIAVVGALVFDRVRTAGGIERSGLGGIAYAVGALSALGGDRVHIRPVCRVGEDLIDRVGELWGRAGNISCDGLVVGPAPTARVEARHGGGAVGGDREERLLDPPTPLTRAELEPALDADRILLNCITGFDVERSAAEWLAERGAPVHLDLHSLMLGRAPGGRRFPRRPRELERWVGLADTLQCNRQEAELAAEGKPLPEWLRRRFAGGLRAAIVTRGAEGATLYEAAGARSVAAPAVRAVDPTGAGDVLGAAWTLEQAEGTDSGPALERAVAAASASCALCGAEQMGALVRVGGSDRPA